MLTSGRSLCGVWEGEEKAIGSAGKMLGLETVDFVSEIGRVHSRDDL